jgi:hypothetical protein
MAGQGGGLGGLGKALGEGLAPAEDALKDFAAQIKEAQQPLAALVAPLQQAQAALLPFVQALNPSSALQLHQAMRDLYAVVGVALQPVMNALTQVTRGLADSLLPLAQQIAPALADMMAELVPVITDLIATFVELASDALVPLLPIITGLVGIFADLLRGVQIVVSALVGALGGALHGAGASIKEVMQGLRETIQKFISYMIQALAAIAQFFGLTGLVQRMAAGARAAAGQGNVGMMGRMADAFRKQGAATGMGAAEGVHFAGLEQFGREMAQAAANAGPAGQEKKTQGEWLAQLAGDLADIRDNGKSLQGVIVAALTAFWNTIKDGVGDAVRKRVNEFEESEWNPFNPSSWGFG